MTMTILSEARFRSCAKFSKIFPLMTKLDKYKKAFVEAFEISEDMVEKLEYNSIVEWDSVGHMGLMAELEDAFDITLEMEDIIDFSSYQKGIETLAKYGIQINE